MSGSRCGWRAVVARGALWLWVVASGGAGAAEPCRPLCGLDDANPFQRAVKATVVDAEAVKEVAEGLREAPPEARPVLTLPPFHRRDPAEEAGLARLNQYAFCALCHPPLPHRREVRTRTFNNLHIGFVACETCHLERDGAALDHRWFDLEAAAPVEAGPLPSSADRVGAPTAVRIAPFADGRPVMVTRAEPLYRELAAAWEGLDVARKAESVVRLHGPLAAEGAACADCHREEGGLLAIEALGAGPEAIEAYRDSTLVRFFRRYPAPGKGAEGEAPRIRILDLLR